MTGERVTPIFQLPFPRTVGLVRLGAFDLQQLAERVEALLVELASTHEAGDLRPTSETSAPAGWLMCEGQEVSRSTYSVLFAAIGTAFGAGNGTTTFNVPDPRGRFLLCAGTPAELVGLEPPTAKARGERGGVEGVTLTAGQSGLQPHNHPFGPPFALGLAGFAAAQGGQNSAGSGGTEVTGYASTNAAAAHTNLPPFTLINWMIKT